MRRWVRAVRDTTCGYDGARIAKGEPVQFLELVGCTGPHRTKRRCQEHAIGPVNWKQIEAEDAARVHVPEVLRRHQPMTRVAAATVLDFKSAAAGERE